MRGKIPVYLGRGATVVMACALLLTLVSTTVSAAWIEQTKLAADDGALADQFGGRNALRGETALIGAALDDDLGVDSGSAYVFTGSGATWTESQKLTAGDGAAGNAFGSAVGLDGDFAVVGAYGADAAYMFEKQSGTWTQTQKLTPGCDTFGACADLEGTTAVVGIHTAASGTTGAAYVYNYDAGTSTWSLAQTLTGAGSVRNFGNAVDLSGSRLIVGDRRFRTSIYQGAAFIYDYNAGTSTWDYAATLMAPDPTNNDYFGFAVATDGNLAAVGAYCDDDRGTDSGSVYLFEKDDVTGVWSQVAKLYGSDINQLDYFGSSVALENGVLMAGAYNSDTGGETYVFEEVGGAWMQTAKLFGPDANEKFGTGLAMDGDTALVGAYQGDGPEVTITGAVYVYTFDGSHIRPGDADLDGDVDAADAAALGAHWLQSEGVDWSMGDFNHDGVVDDLDATMLAVNWTGSLSAAVPEPDVLFLLGSALLSAAALFTGKRRRQ